MDSYEYRLNATYNKNILYFQSHHPHIYKKLQEHPKALQEYKIVYHKSLDGGHFNIQHKETGKFFYAEDSSVMARNFVQNANNTRDFFVTTVAGHVTNRMSVVIDDYNDIISYIAKNNNKETRERLNPHKIVFLGAGLGTHIELASRELSTLRVILVIEPSIELLKISAMFIDYEDLSKRQLLYISSDEDEDQMYYRYRQLESPFASYNFSIKFHFLNDTYRQYLSPITKRFMTTNIYELSFEHFLSKDENKYLNLFKYPTLDFQRTIINKDIPVMLIMSGPSLKNSIEFLKQARKKFFFVTVGSALYKLHEHGITPDICVAMDGKKRKIDEFVDLPKQYLDKVQFFIADLVDPDVSKMLNPIITFNRAQRTVGHQALAVVCELGFQNIYTIGNDVCVSESGNEYVEGLPFKEKIAREQSQGTPSKGINYDRTLPVEGNFREKVFSKMKFLSYVKTYEGMRDAFYFFLNVYNLSDGALIKGMTSLRPEDVDLDSFAEIDFKKCINYKLLDITKRNIEEVDYQFHIDIATLLQEKIANFKVLNIPSKRLDEYISFRDTHFLGDFAKEARRSSIVNDSVIRYIMFADNSMLNFFDNKNFSGDEFEKHFKNIFDLYIKGFEKLLSNAKNTLVYAKTHFDKLKQTEEKINIYITMEDDEYLLFLKLKNKLEVEVKKPIKVVAINDEDIKNKKNRAFLAPSLGEFSSISIVLDAKKHIDTFFDVDKLYEEIKEDKSIVVAYDKDKDIYVFNNVLCKKLSKDYILKSKNLSSFKWVKQKDIKNINIKLDNSIKEKYETFYIKDEDIKPYKGEMPRKDAKIVYLFCVDHSLFSKYYTLFLSSANKINGAEDVHFHCIRTFGTNEKDNQELVEKIRKTYTNINVTLSYEDKMLRNTDKKYPKTYYHCLPLLVLDDILNHSKADVFSLSLSAIMKNPITNIQKTKDDILFFIGGNDDSNFMAFYKNNKSSKQFANNLKQSAFYELSDKSNINDNLFAKIFNHNIKLAKSFLKHSELNQAYRDTRYQDDSYIWLADAKSENLNKYKYECYQGKQDTKEDTKETLNMSVSDIESSNRQTLSLMSANKNANINKPYSGYIDVAFIDKRNAVMFVSKGDDQDIMDILGSKVSNKTQLKIWCLLSRLDKDIAIYDLGARSGLYSVSAQLFNSNVVSLEDDMLLYSRMILNLQENNLSSHHAYFMKIGNKNFFNYKSKHNVLDNQIRSRELSFMTLKNQLQPKQYMVRVGKNFHIDTKSIKQEINKNHPDLLIEDFSQDWVDNIDKKYNIWYINEEKNFISKEASTNSCVFMTIKSDKIIRSLLNEVVTVKNI